MAIMIQYVGFHLKPRGRDYSYKVMMKSNTESRQFTFTISDQAFAAKRIPYQDAADICYQKLQKELLAETEARPLRPHFTVSDKELDEYREKHRPVKKRFR